MTDDELWAYLRDQYRRLEDDQFSPDVLAAELRRLGGESTNAYLRETLMEAAGLAEQCSREKPWPHGRYEETKQSLSQAIFKANQWFKHQYPTSPAHP